MIMNQKALLSKYFSEIGQKGGRVSRRKLSSETAKLMVQVREARRAFKKYHAQCFWSYNPKYQIRPEDVAWVGKQLMKHGDQKLWFLGSKLCR